MMGIMECHRIYSNTVHAGQWAPSTSMALSPTSMMAIVDTINSELEALNDQSWILIEDICFVCLMSSAKYNKNK
jgi:hypothetical protein